MRPDIETAFRVRQQRARQAEATSAMVTSTTGFISIDGHGQALLDVAFPVTYTEKPSLSYSFDLAEGQVLDPENFPTLSIGVHFYQFTERVPGAREYNGARLIIVATGHDGLQMVVHYRFEGVALANPQSSGSIP